MSSFSFVHAADLHLDTPFDGIAKLAPDVARALRDASLDAFDRLVQLTLDREAAFLLLAGDLYDGPERGVRAQLRFERGVRRLSDRGIPTFIVHGNHDPLDGWSAIQEWPEGLTVFGSDEVGSVGVEKDGTRIATVHGLSYATRDTTENLAARFRRGPEPGLQIGLLHCNLGGSAEHAAYAPCQLEDLRRSRLDYWALGHIHRRQVISKTPWVVYPGNLQGRSPKPSELGAKGAVVVNADRDVIQQSVEFEALDVARFVGIGLDIGRCSDLPALAGALMDRARALREDHRGRGLLVRARLSGRGPLHRLLGRPAAMQELLEDLRERCRSMDPFLYWEGLRDGTQLEIDRSAILARADFSSDLLKFVDGLSGDDEALQRFVNESVGSLAQRKLPIDTSAFTPEASEALLREAEALALDLLEPEDAS